MSGGGSWGPYKRVFGAGMRAGGRTVGGVARYGRLLLLLLVVALVAGPGAVGEIAATVGTVVRAGGQGLAGGGQECRRARRPVRVPIHVRRWPNVADHVADVARDFPRVLVLARPAADENRAQSLRGVPTRPGMDRDEYPPAVSAQGGYGADVRHVPSGENRSAGQHLGERLADYCDGQAFRMVVIR